MVSHPSSLAETASLARISVGDASLAVSRRGAGNAPTVLLAHGFGQTRHAWEATAMALADAGYQALSFDARGHGDSSPNPASLPYSAAQFTDDLILSLIHI